VPALAAPPPTEAVPSAEPAHAAPPPPAIEASPFEEPVQLKLPPPSVGPPPPAARPQPTPQPPPIGAFPQPQPPPRELAIDARRLQGTWSILAREENGQEAEPGGDSTALIAGNAFVVVWGAKDRPDERSIDADTFILDVGHEPRWIDLAATETEPGRNSGRLRHGIYRVEGSSLLICTSAAGLPRPKDFDTTPGSGQRLYILRRKKAPRQAPGMPGGPGTMPGMPAPGQPSSQPMPNPAPTTGPDAQSQPAPRAEPAPSTTPAPAGPSVGE
jgi:uncharacterized protein (TIGR03067 family)